MLAAMRRVHPDLHHSVTRSELASAVDKLQARLPELRTEGILVELMRLASLPGRDGRDGHTGLWPFQSALEVHMLPLHVYLFDDGVFIVDADEATLVGRELVQIGGLSIDKVLELVRPLVFVQDNQYGQERYMPLYAMMVEVLAALGVAEAGEPVRVVTRGSDGALATHQLEGLSVSEYHRLFPKPAKLPVRRRVLSLQRHLSHHFWFTELESRRAMYFQYNSVQKLNEPWEPMWAFVERLGRALDASAAERLIVDLRHNGGGNNQTYGDLLSLLEHSRFNQPGRLWVLMGRVTYSAAGDFVTELENRTHARFVGEPTGSSPNAFGDAEVVVLPRSCVEVEVATRFWETAGPNDTRLWHEPDAWVGLKSTDFFADRDPALEAALTNEVQP